VLLGDTTGSLSASLLAGGGFTIGRNITVQSGSSGTAALGVNTASIATFSGNIALNKNAILTAPSGGEAIFSGVISGTGFGITKSGAGTVTLTSANTYTGGTTLSQGTLKLGVNDALGTGGLTFAGGILDANNRSDSTIGALSLTANSTLNLHAGGAAGLLTFTSVATVTGGRTLTINGWSGSAGGAGTDDRIFITADPTGSGILGQIQFTGYAAGANWVSGSGEIVPVPEPINVALGVFGAVFLMFGFGRRLYKSARGKRNV
jgi:autotransporter-associated beta strand protein